VPRKVRFYGRLRTDDSLHADDRDRDWVGWFTTKVYTLADVGGTPASYTVGYQTYPNAVPNGPLLSVA